MYRAEEQRCRIGKEDTSISGLCVGREAGGFLCSVEKLEEAVKEAKKNREWRHEYMTLLMKDQANEKGYGKGYFRNGICFKRFEYTSRYYITKITGKNYAYNRGTVS